MKTEVEIQKMKSEIEKDLLRLRKECCDLGIKTVESQLVFTLMEEKIKLLDEILEIKICYG